MENNLEFDERYDRALYRGRVLYETKFKIIMPVTHMGGPNIQPVLHFCLTDSSVHIKFDYDDYSGYIASVKTYIEEHFKENRETIDRILDGVELYG